MRFIKNFIIIKTIATFIVPYIFLYALYIQINGEISPGGGFQAGVIFASALIVLEIIFGRNKFTQYISIDGLVILATCGVLIYAFTGAISLAFGDNYLNYNSLTTSLATSSQSGQVIGIFIIELGVGFTVSSVLCLIYLLFQK